MIFERIVNDTPQTPYAPTWDFRVGTSKCDDIDVKSLSQFLLSKEREVKKLPVTKIGNEYFDGYTGLGINSTTSRSCDYNILTWKHPELKKLKTNIIKNIFAYNGKCGNETPSELYAICWYNILRFRQKIKPHLHSAQSDCYLSGHFNVQVKDTSTCYMSPVNQLNNPDIMEMKNEEGKMTLFPSYILHYTTRHNSFKPRITIAFDISYFKFHNNYTRL